MSAPTTDLVVNSFPVGPFTDDYSIECFGTPAFGIETMRSRIRLHGDLGCRTRGFVDAHYWLKDVPRGLHFVIESASNDEFGTRGDKIPMTQDGLEVYVRRLNAAIWRFCGMTS